MNRQQTVNASPDSPTDPASPTTTASAERETERTLMPRCDVQDTGIGISKADQARLFTLPERGDGTATRRYGGTGLGLALSRKQIHLMNGEIVVHSQPGTGSTFRFTRLQAAG